MKRILIVDDSAIVRQAIGEFLKDVPDLRICGEAVNGLDAIEKAKKLKPTSHLINSPAVGANGWWNGLWLLKDFLREIRRANRFKEVRVAQ